MRGFLAWRETVGIPAAIFGALVIMPLVWSGWFAVFTKDQLWKATLAMSGLGLVLWIPYFLIMVLPAWRAFRRGEQRTTEWRKQWAELERASAAFRANSANRPPAGQERGDADQPPPLPYVRWHFSNYIDAPSTPYQAGEGGIAAGLAQRLVLGLMADRFLELEGRSVVFRTEIEGAPAIGLCTMCSDSMQFWSIFSVRQVGGTITPRLQCGYQWWLGPSTLDTGKRYSGDYSQYVRRTMNLNGTVFFGVVFAMLVPPLGMFGYAALVFKGGKTLLRQLVRRDRGTVLTRACEFDAGDSADLAILQAHRGDAGYGVVPGNGPMADYASLRTQVLTAAHGAAAVLQALRG